MKICVKCSEAKNETEFYKEKKMPDGRRKECKKCRNLVAEKWRETNRDKYNETMRNYNAKNYSRLRLQRYDISEEDYNKLLKEQNNCCAMCEKGPSANRPLAIDHNHKTGKVRQLLCYGCNRAIAILEDPLWLASAFAYLKKHSA